MKIYADAPGTAARQVFTDLFVAASGRYSDERLEEWTHWIAGQTASGRAVWAYFNNDPEAHAIADARTLRAMVRRSIS